MKTFAITALAALWMYQQTSYFSKKSGSKKLHCAPKSDAELLADGITALIVAIAISVL